MVGVPLNPPAAGPAVVALEPRNGVDQGRRDDRRVAVDPAEERAHAGRCPLQLLPGWRPGLRPQRLVPALADQHTAGRLSGRVRGQPVEGVGEAGTVMQVELGQPEAGLDRVHVRVDERGREERAVQVDDLVGSVVRRRAALVTYPGDPVTFDGQRVSGSDGWSPWTTPLRNRVLVASPVESLISPAMTVRPPWFGMFYGKISG